MKLNQKHIKRSYTVRLMAPGSPSKKAGQPHPESNFVLDLYRGVLHPTQLKIPSSKNLSYSPVPGILKQFHQNMKTDPSKILYMIALQLNYHVESINWETRDSWVIRLERKRKNPKVTYSVPFCRRILNCSGERIARHSSSVFLTTSPWADAITAT